MFDKYFMDEAVKEAENALEKNEIPVGCVVIANNAIVARGHNLTNCESDPLSHAELVALRHCPRQEGLTFYITCEPCIMCLGILERINARVFYGCSNAIFGDTTILNRPPTIFCREIHRESAIKLLQRFFLKENHNAPPEKRKAKAKRKTRQVSAHAGGLDAL